MEWYEILPIVIVVLLTIFTVFIIVLKSSYNKSITDITEMFSKIENSNEIIIRNRTDLFQIEVIGNKRYLVKILIVNPKNEVIITNSEKVVINSDIDGWKRSSKPLFVAGIKDFIKLDKNEADLIKIVLVYPDCHNITKYINESDCYIVDKNKKIYGLYFLKYNELREFLLNE